MQRMAKEKNSSPQDNRKTINRINGPFIPAIFSTIVWLGYGPGKSGVFWKQYIQYNTQAVFFNETFYQMFLICFW